jgi:hypothetical protein
MNINERKNKILEDVAASVDSVKKGKIFAIETSKLIFGNKIPNNSYIDGSGDGKIDIAYFGYLAGNKTWHLCQCKYGEGWESEKTIFGEGEELLRRIKNEDFEGLSKEATEVYRQVIEYIKQNNNIFIKFITNKPNDLAANKAIKEINKKHPQIKFEIIYFDDINSSFEEDEESAFTIKLVDTIHTRHEEYDSYLAILELKDLSEALKNYEDSGCNFDHLFNTNIRGDKGETSVNKDIRKTYKDEPKNMFAYNNGLTVVGKSAIILEENTLKIYGAQVKNGQQTLINIRKGMVNSEKEGHGIYNGHLPIKIIITKDLTLDSNITKKSNKQNGIKRDDFASQDRELIKLTNNLSSVHGVNLPIRKERSDKKQESKHRPRAIDLVPFIMACFGQNIGKAVHQISHFSPDHNEEKGKYYKELESILKYNLHEDNLFAAYTLKQKFNDAFLKNQKKKGVITTTGGQYILSFIFGRIVYKLLVNCKEISALIIDNIMKITLEESVLFRDVLISIFNNEELLILISNLTENIYYQYMSNNSISGYCINADYQNITTEDIVHLITREQFGSKDENKNLHNIINEECSLAIRYDINYNLILTNIIKEIKEN